MDLDVGMRCADRIGDQRARHTWQHRLTRGVDAGHYDHVRVDEGILERLGQRRDPAVSVRLEDRDDPPEIAALGRCQGDRDFGGQMRVVVNERDSGGLTPEREATCDSGESGKGALRGVHGDAECGRRRQRSGGVQHSGLR